MKRVTRLLTAAVCLTVSVAHAEEPISPARRGAAITTAIVPGVLVRGAGHFVAKKPKTGRTLLAVGSSGLGVAVASLVGIAVTGASRRTTAPLATGIVLGIGAFSLSFLADLYGVAVPENRRGTPTPRRTWFQMESGLWARYDRQFAGRVLFHQAIEGVFARRHDLRLELDALPGDPSLRARGVYGYRVLAASGDNSHLALEGGMVHQRFPNHGFFATTFEGAVSGRYDLARVGPSLRGAFVEGRAGAAISALSSRNADVEADEALLLRWAFGAYLGHGRGEVQAFYDHRRDTYAGGALLERGSGYAGFVGAKGNWFFTDHVGVQADFQIGSALLTGVSVLFREGAR